MWAKPPFKSAFNAAQVLRLAFDAEYGWIVNATVELHFDPLLTAPCEHLGAVSSSYDSKPRVQTISQEMFRSNDGPRGDSALARAAAVDAH